MTTPVTERLHSAIDRRFDDEVAFLQRLVQTPSDNPPGNCSIIGDMAADELMARGFEVEKFPVPEDQVRATGMESCTILIVRCRFGSGEGPVIALNAHGDVVPPGDGWTYPPYSGEIHDDCLYGRGAAVSKSDIATYTFALLALQDVASEAEFNGSIELHLTFDEEIGGLVGPAYILEQNLSQPDLCISAGLSYSVVTAHNGCLHLEVVLKGKSAHAAAPETGNDALEAMTGVLQVLYGHRVELETIRSSTPGIDHPRLTIGLIEGGINTNVVPDRCAIRLDRRIIPEEDPALVETSLRKLIAEAASVHRGIGCEVRHILLARPLVHLEGADPMIRSVQRHAKRILREDIPTKGVPLFTDARLYPEKDIPTISYGAGPRSFLEANGHRANEHVRLGDLRAATEIVACTLADLLSGKAA